MLVIAGPQCNFDQEFTLISNLFAESSSGRCLTSRLVVSCCWCWQPSDCEGADEEGTLRHDLDAIYRMAERVQRMLEASGDPPSPTFSAASCPRDLEQPESPADSPDGPPPCLAEIDASLHAKGLQ